MSSGKEGCDFWMVSGWFVRCLAGLWVVCGFVWLVCGWFVDGLAGLWVVSSFTANDKLNVSHSTFMSERLIKILLIVDLLPNISASYTS